MTKLYEALQARTSSRAAPIHMIPPAASVLPDTDSPLLRREELLSLYQSIETLLPEGTRHAIEFISATHGEGTSTVAREFAQTVARTTGKRVLLLTVPSSHVRPNGHAGTGLDAALEGAITIEQAVRPNGHPGVFETTLWADEHGGRHLFDLNLMGRALDELLTMAELVVIDAPAALSNFAGLAMARSAGGVVLVVEAERTRSPIVEQARRSLEANGGHLLGAVFNKRRHHIPRQIYRWL